MKHLYILFLFLTFSAIAQDKTVVMPNGSSIPEWVNLTEIESTLTPGSVIFAGTSGVLSQDASNLFFENSTDRLGVGTNAAGLGTEASVTAVRSINGTSLAIWGANVSTGASAVNAVRVANNAGNVFDMRVHGTNHSSLPAVGMMLATGSGGLYLSTESTQTIFVSNSGSGNVLARFTNTGVGIAGVTVPSAMLHLPAGTATAGTAPMKLTTGTALTTPSDGALEYHSSHLYFTIGSTRYQLDQQGGGGITNGAANTELTMSDGTNLDPSGLFIPSEGNLTLGSTALAGTTKTINAEVSGTGPAWLTFSSKSGSAASGLYTFANTGNASLPDITIAFDHASAANVNVSLDPKGSGIIGLASDNVNGGVSGTVRWLMQSSGSSTVLFLGDAASSGAYGELKSQNGSVSAGNNGRELRLTAGNAELSTGNGNGGSIIITSGERRTSGSGTDGNITIDSLTGFLIISTIPTSSAGLPSGAVWANSNVLTIVP